VKILITHKLVRAQQNNNTQRKQWNRKNLQKKEKLKQYRRSLHNKLEMAEECKDINTEWQQIKDSVLNAATGVIQNENKKPQNEWWDDECRKAMEEKNFAQMKCINRRTRINQDDCMEKRKTANCICKRKKKELLNDKIKQIEEMKPRNSIKTAFFNKKQTQIIPLCKDNNGEIISERISVLENWKQYFNNILNFKTQQAKSNTEVPLQDIDEEEIEIPIHKEINNIISKLKRNKAPGPDCITFELINP
jgi:hypothetical protein